MLVKVKMVKHFIRLVGSIYVYSNRYVYMDVLLYCDALRLCGTYVSSYVVSIYVSQCK